MSFCSNNDDPVESSCSLVSNPDKVANPLHKTSMTNILNAMTNKTIRSGDE